MYESHFGLKKRPFASVPCVEQYFAADAMAAARSTLARCIQRAEGTGMVVGPSGTGKTLLCQLLAEQFQHELAVVHLSSAGVSTRRTLFQAILYELGRPYRGMDEGELRLALVDYLTADEDQPPAMLLLLDDAHSLPIRLLDEIRMLASLAADGQPRVRLVLAGMPLLEEQLASPKLESFSQRIVARCYLEPFSREETARYVQAQMDGAGAGKAIFPPEAGAAVHKATDGVPRLINQLCDHALLLAYAGGKRQVGAAGIEEAWADLQQLPAPTRSDSDTAGVSANLIEFGQLTDEAESETSPVCGTIAPSGAPSLRLTPGPQERCDEPIARLEKIEKTLADLDDDFEPAGSIEPEVELVFDACQDPFGETFAEETVVVDRYQPSKQSGKQRPPVRLEPIPAQPLPAPRRSGPPATVEYGTLDDDPYQAGESSAKPAASAECVAEPPRSPAPAASDADLLSRCLATSSTQAWQKEPETVRLHRHTAQAATAPSEADEDVIVIEDGYEVTEPLQKRQVAVVRQHEYGQLFARLRRSC